MILPAPLHPDAGKHLPGLMDFTTITRHHPDATGLYQLERAQRDVHPGDPSWRAFAVGDWDRALALIDARRPSVERHYRSGPAAAIKRVRILEEPLASYLQWELHLLRLHDDVTGGTVRILPAIFAAGAEAAHGTELPDLTIIDDTDMYLRRPGADAVRADTFHYTDTKAISEWRDCIEGLWACGWPLGDYFDTYVRHLPAPEPNSGPPDR